MDKHPTMKHREEHHLLRLPGEILNGILSHVLPNLTSIQWTLDNIVVDAFTHPILQTNRALRQASLALIHRRTIWIYLDLDDDHLIHDLSNEIELYMVPRALKSLIRSVAAKIHLHFSNLDELPSRVTRSKGPASDTFIYPFNFERLLHLSYKISELAAYEEGTFNLTFQCQNIANRFDQQLNELAVSAISTLHHLDRINFKLEGKSWSPHVGETYIKMKKWHLQSLVDKAQDVYDRVENLINQGYHDEAGLLALSSYSLYDKALEILPRATHWISGEADPEQAHIEDSEASDSEDDDDVHWRTKAEAGRTAMGNRYRTLVHSIELVARLGFAKNVAVYGRDWLMNHDWLFVTDFERRFLKEHSIYFDWFGLSLTESAELYSSRARCHEVIAGIVYDNHIHYFNQPYVSPLSNEDVGSVPLSHNQRVHVKMAGTLMYFARTLRPDYIRYQIKYDQYKSLLGVRHAREMENAACQRFVIVYDQSDSEVDKSNRRVMWAGDRWFLQTWGAGFRTRFQEGTGDDDSDADRDDEIARERRGSRLVRRYLPLAQKGLDVSPTFTEWGLEFDP